MKIIVTGGPAYEPIDAVRRITNHSTGELGTLLTNALTTAGHEVLYFRGSLSTFRRPRKVHRIIEFTTNSDLNVKLSVVPQVDAFFHTAALSDFRVKENTFLGESTKFSSDREKWILELEPQTKIISSLRRRFPHAWIVGWKYEVNGIAAQATYRAVQQIEENATDACIINGPAFSQGFGFCTKDGLESTLKSKSTLVKYLVERLKRAF